MTLSKLVRSTAAVALLGSASAALASHTCTVTERYPGGGANVCVVNCDTGPQDLIAIVSPCGAPTTFVAVPGEGASCGFVPYTGSGGCVPLIRVRDGAGNTVQCTECTN